MEDEQFSDTTPPASLIPPFPRDSRGSLEVFNPSIFSSAAKPTKTTTGSPAFRSQQTWQSWIDPLATTPEPDPLPNLASKSTSAADITTSWMALKDVAHHSPTPSPLSNIQQTISSSFVDANDKPSDDAAQGAAEWGLVLKTDEETGKPQGVGVRTSNGPEDSTSKPSLGGGIEASRRNSKYLLPTWSLMQSSVWGQEDLQVRRLQRVVKENDRVYLMRVPSPGSLPPLPAFSMVKPLAMSEVLDASKEKMFASLVPDSSAKALSRYTDVSSP